MLELIIRLHEILNICKDFITGYSSNKEDEMVVRYKDEFYKVHFERVEAPVVTDKLRKNYSNAEDELIQLGELLK